MAAPVGNNNTINPVGAFGLGNSHPKYEAGNFVVQPPKTVYKYSVYDEFDLGKDGFKELWQSVEPNAIKSSYRKSKAKTIVKKFVQVGLIFGSAFLAYKHRVPVRNFFVNILNNVKNIIRR